MFFDPQILYFFCSSFGDFAFIFFPVFRVADEFGVVWMALKAQLCF